MERLVNYIILITLLMLALPFGTISAQTTRPLLQSLAGQAESLLDLELSPTGRYALISKSHENKQPSFTIRDTQKPIRKIVKSGISKYFFVTDNMLMVQKGSKAYRIDLLTWQETEISNVQNIGIDEGLGLLLIHFDATRNNELGIYDRNMKLKETIQAVSRWTVTKGKTIIFAAANNENKLLKLNADGRSIKEIWSSPQAIYSVFEADMHKEGYLVNCVAEGGLQTSWTDGNGNVVELKSPLLKQYDHIIVNRSADPKAVFLTVSKKIPSDNHLVSVWYGNEKDLKKYTQGDRELTNLLWYPQEKRIIILDAEYNGYSAIGHSGNFLRVKIDKTKTDVMEGFHGVNKDDVYLWNSATEKETALPKDLGFLYIDESERYLLSKGEGNWHLFDTESLQSRAIDMPAEAVPYFVSNHSIIWCMKYEVLKQDILRLTKKRIFYAPWADHAEIVNTQKESTDAGTNRMLHYVLEKDHLLIRVMNKDRNTVSYISLDGDKQKLIIPETTDRINKFKTAGNGRHYIWSSENFNRHPVVTTSSSKLSEITIDSMNRKDVEADQISKITVSYKGSDNRNLKGSVFFPSGFDPLKKYPVVLSIYEEQQEFANKFLLATMKNSRGINVRLLLESGYIVMLPDITYGDQGPGLSALLCISNALDALSGIPQADMKRVGLIGQSFGGYETNFIAAHSARFAALISGASISDIIHTSYSFNYNFHSPDYWRYEEGQFRMNTSFVNNNKKYFDNNPLYKASQVQAPMLLWTGTVDKNVDQEETRTLYNVLRKHRKPVIALFYNNEGHSLSTKDAQTDLTLRVLDWFDYFLQNKRDISWISKQMKDAL